MASLSVDDICQHQCFLVVVLVARLPSLMAVGNKPTHFICK